MPLAAAAHSVSLASTGCGAWSVATQSMVPSASACAERVDVGPGAQRRVDLEDRVVVSARSSVSSRWCGVTSAVTATPLPFAHRMISTDPAVDTWQTCKDGVDVGGEQAVARDDRLLRGGWPAGQAEPGGDLALVELRALGQPRLLSVLRDHAVERLDVLKRPPHQQRVGHAQAVVGEDPDAGGGVGHRAELGELLAVQADRDRADWPDVDVPGLVAEPPDLLHHAGRVGDRLGVGHRVHCRVPAERGGPGTGLDGLGILPAWLTQVRVQVNEAGQRDKAAGVEDRLLPVRPGPGRSRR